MKEFGSSSRSLRIVLICKRRSIGRTHMGLRKWISQDQSTIYRRPSVLRGAFSGSEFARALFVLGYVHVLRVGRGRVCSGLYSGANCRTRSIALREHTLASSIST